MPGWDEETRTWWGWEFLGPAPGNWEGPRRDMPAEEGLHAYQIRNIPVPILHGLRILGGPRPPYFSWHGHPTRTGQPHFSIDERKAGGNGIYLAQTYDTALRHAGEEGEVLSFYTNAMKLVLLDARWERVYSPAEASAILGRPLPGSVNGLDLLHHLNGEHGPGSGLTEFLRQLGYNGIAYGATSRGEGGWCIFDPRVFKRYLRTRDWSLGEIRRREAFDPPPIDAGTTPLEDIGSGDEADPDGETPRGPERATRLEALMGAEESSPEPKPTSNGKSKPLSISEYLNSEAFKIGVARQLREENARSAKRFQEIHGHTPEETKAYLDRLNEGIREVPEE